MWCKGKNSTNINAPSRSAGKFLIRIAAEVNLKQHNLEPFTEGPTKAYQSLHCNQGMD